MESVHDVEGFHVSTARPAVRRCRASGLHRSKRIVPTPALAVEDATPVASRLSAPALATFGVSLGVLALSIVFVVFLAW